MATQETATPLGTCLLICPQYGTNVNRRDYEEDVKNIRSSFAAKYSIEDYHIDDNSTNFLRKLDSVQSSSFLLYFTGYGSCDSNGQVYILLGDKPEQKVNLYEIVSTLQGKCPCTLLFELSCRTRDDIASPILRLPTCNNIVVAISSLTQEEKRNNDGGIWTKNLCDTVKEYDNRIPMTTILDLVWHKCSSKPYNFFPQYTASCYKPKPSQPINDEWYLQFIFGPSPPKTGMPSSDIGSGVSSVSTGGIGGRVYKTSDTPCSGHVFEALTNQGIADKWREIGGKLDRTILDPNKLRNIRGDNAAAIRLMISRCSNLKWFHLIGAIRNSCGKDKADGITEFLKSPYIFPKCP